MKSPNYAAGLMAHLTNFFEKYEYELLLSRNQFRKKLDTGFQNVIPSVSQYTQESLVEINMGVRLDVVENAINQFTSHLKEFHPDTNTIITSLGHLMGKQYFRYKVASKDDLARVCGQIRSFMEEKGFLFLDKSLDIGHLDILLNTEPRKISPYCPNYYHQCLKGMVIARINQNPEWDELALVYRGTMRKRALPEEQIQKFDKLIYFLKSFSMN